MGDFKKAAQQVNAALKKLTAFKDSWYEKLTQAVHQSFEFNLHYEYTRATEDDSLLDVELNLAAAGGKELAHAAAAGDFSKVLDSFDPTLVQINPGALFTKQGGLLHVFTIESQIKQLTSKKDRSNGSPGHRSRVYGQGQKDWLARVGFAYQSPAFYELYKEGFTAVLIEGKGVTLPGWFTGGVPLQVALDESMRHVIVTLLTSRETI